MADLDPLEEVPAFQIRKKIGYPSGYGGCIYGISMYGYHGYVSGIYRIRTIDGKQIQQKMKFYRPSNPQTAPQQSWRAVFANAIAGWQVLTPEQKAVYNESAKNKKMSGYNLYIREYLNSN